MQGYSIFGSKFDAIQHTLVNASNRTEFRYEAVSRLIRLFGASSAAFMHWAEARRETEKMRREDLYLSGMDEKYRDLYYREVVSSDPLTQWNSQHGAQMGVTTLGTITSPRQLQSSSLYQKILSPNKSHDILTIALVVKRALLGNISIARPEGAAKFNQHDVQLARLLAPTLSASYCNVIQAEEITRNRLARLHQYKLADAAPDARSKALYGPSKREQEIVEKVFDAEQWRDWEVFAYQPLDCKKPPAGHLSESRSQQSCQFVDEAPLEK